MKLNTVYVQALICPKEDADPDPKKPSSRLTKWREAKHKFFTFSLSWSDLRVLNNYFYYEDNYMPVQLFNAFNLGGYLAFSIQGGFPVRRTCVYIYSAVNAFTTARLEANRSGQLVYVINLLSLLPRLFSVIWRESRFRRAGCWSVSVAFGQSPGCIFLLFAFVLTSQGKKKTRQWVS